MAEHPSSAEQRMEDGILLARQLEDLGTKRRDFISTTDSKENKAAYRTVTELEGLRQSRQVSEGRHHSQGLRKLKAWNDVYVELHDDGTAQAELRDVNEGLGQTHRAKLLTGQTSKDPKVEYPSKHRKPQRGGPSRGNNKNQVRLGGHVVGNPGVSPASDPSRAVTRQRIPRGDVGLLAVPPEQGNGNLPLRGRPETKSLTSSKPSESFKRRTRTFEGILATPASFMGSVQGNASTKAASTVSRTSSNSISSTLRTPKAPSIPAPIPANSTNSLAHLTPNADKVVMGQSSASSNIAIEPQDQPATEQPYPTDPDSLETLYELLTVEQRAEFRRGQAQRPQKPTSASVQAPALMVSSLAPASARAVTPPAPISAVVVSPPEPAISRLVSPPVPIPARVVSPPAPSSASLDASVSASALTPLAVARTARLRLAEGRAKQREAIIGEHVARTRFHPATASENLANDFEKLRISDESQEPLIAKSVNVPLEKKPPVVKSSVAKMPPKATSNPFGGSTKGSSRPAGPSLPPHLMNLKPSSDPGAAARAQYGNGQDPLGR